MPSPDLVTALKTDAADRAPRGRRGVWLSFVGAYGLEVLFGQPPADGASARPEWVGVDLQHGELEVRDLASILRVSERLGLPLLARMPSHDGGDIGRALDAGVDGVIVPTVESAEQAEALVHAVRLPPRGGRSAGAARSSLGVTAAHEPLLLTMVETRAGLDAAAEIVATDGVDGLFMGPYDLSVSLGVTPTDPANLTAIGRAVDRARSVGKIAGMYAGLPELVALGPTLDLVAVDSDITLLRRGLEAVFGPPGK